MFGLRRLPGRLKRILLFFLAVIAVFVALLAIPVTRNAVSTGAGKALDAALRLAPTSDVSKLLDKLPERSRILAADGTEIAQSWWQNRVVVKTDQIAPVMRQAQIAIEDVRFYEHGSSDLQSIGRAAIANATSGDATGQGGSTIEQQLAKNITQLQAELDNSAKGIKASTDKTLSRKIDDVILAAHLSDGRGKEQVLTDYLNLVYYGNGAYGVEAAAQRYFNTHASDLTLPQAALIAGLVQSPSAYDPMKHPKAATNRRNQVLDAMHANGMIPEDKYKEAKESDLGLKPTATYQGCANSKQPWMCQFAVSRLLASPEFGKTREDRQKTWETGGLTLTTTMDVKAQKSVDQTLKNPGLPSRTMHASAAVVRAKTGEVLAIGQDVPYGNGKGRTTQSMSIDAVDGGKAAYQAGSLFKVFTMAAALANGYGPASIINAPVSGTPMNVGTFKTCKSVGNEIWAPKNAPGDPDGPMTLVEALAKSVNTAFVQLEAQVGLCEVRDTAHKLGVKNTDGSDLELVPSITLGTAITSPLTMASSYAPFTAEANGQHCAPTPLKSLKGREVDITFNSKCNTAVDGQAAANMRSALQQVVHAGTAQKAALPGVPVGGKTGTNDNSTSTWFTGIAPGLAASVWVGDTSGASYDKLYGGTYAAPLWGQIMAPLARQGQSQGQ
ncbi:transglycosylase domain-containing protein [Dermatophilus congolensis]|uniref:transglycosylase domain-containing protein n=1 Tax=Dermatophilus congolensis TaxID=1863 RepID=UPI001AAE58C7|nr:transglycosylase domain-containing protein [Dermatophilus congolensis]MBO3143719.1 penicillin-binding protein [Dermatophilus congolensis]MBO3152710.1 penicillin-binding protein [Dermatophilus congolensis]MBO3160280.1 penicillin-binding protein [Dermatophilus congolensis]MBO3163994.1 penicillin-binding protein [Dermatophilus congolensis]MBO3177540.1 penicillin-binding protein [Dermatophilus congolensis]